MPDLFEIQRNCPQWCGLIYDMWKRDNKELGPGNPAIIRETMARGELFVAHAGPRLMGFVLFHVRRDGVATIYDLATHRTARGQGVGRGLVSAVCDQSPLKLVRLKVVTTNPANRFYERVGFTFKGTEKGKTRPLNLWELQR